MARRIRGGTLESRTQRLKLAIAKKPIFVRIGAGTSLGYRRNKAAGTWVLRAADGQGSARTAVIGYADDFAAADGQEFLDYWQAQDRARAAVRGENAIPAFRPLTVDEAARAYLVYLVGKNSRTAADTRGRLNKHFLPKFGAKVVSGLTKTLLEAWHVGLVVESEDPECVRRSKDSANRVLTMVKALLNHALIDKANRLSDDSAWRFVKPFQKVSQPRSIRYSDEEVRRLIRCAPDQSVARLLRGAYLTGARYGELAEARVSHFDARTRTLRVNAGKTGDRTIVLQTAAVRFLVGVVGRRAQREYLFVRKDGARWKRSDQTRPIKLALRKANLSEDGCIYALRHSYISHSIEGEVPLNIIADNCGTSIRMIEKTYAKILAEKRRHFIERGAPTL